MPKKSPSRDLRACKACKKLARNPEVCHVLCSRHRTCSGIHQWNPQGCEDRLTLQTTHVDMTYEDQQATLLETSKMLQRMCKELSLPKERPWEYEDILAGFLQLDAQPTAAAPAPQAKASQAQEISSTTKLFQQLEAHMEARFKGLKRSLLQSQSANDAHWNVPTTFQREGAPTERQYRSHSQTSSRFCEQQVLTPFILGVRISTLVPILTS